MTLYFVFLPFSFLCWAPGTGVGLDTGAGHRGSGAAHQARHAREALAHAHALVLVDAQRVGLDGQLVLQPALGHHQQLQRVLRLPQPQLEGLQGVVNGEHLVHEPAARAEGKVWFTERVSNDDTSTRCQAPGTTVSKQEKAQLSGETEVERADRGAALSTKEAQRKEQGV